MSCSVGICGPFVPTVSVCFGGMGESTCDLPVTISSSIDDFALGKVEDGSVSLSSGDWGLGGQSFYVVYLAREK